MGIGEIHSNKALAKELREISERITDMCNGGTRPSVQDFINDTVTLNRAAFRLEQMGG